ncbi:uncharacterized protein LOC121242851 [Juglans microcarpa x Juglans regia]|uniref:uncharacterized protein LOC121242851 n=1 Tax=Juglans microcarpa x Juglans regia TaxID=2249226 RepID=UPI001B7F4BE3|nr:uncharacterized protein LOC121242851 [Juglans microcarpa x Juglans regia]
MGKKLDALLGRTFKTSKLNSLVNLAISRLAVFRKKRQVQCSNARSDVVQLLELGHHERALLRVEHVIKEQNMLDVFVMIESYCNLLIERINLIEQERVCPDELKEAISSLLYAASRCGEFPELQEIRAVLTTRYGKEFASRAIELRNNCGVNHKMILKLSTRQPSLENRMKVLKEIASENNIVLQLEEAASISTGENLDVNKNKNQPDPNSPVNSGSAKLGDNSHIPSEVVEKNDGFSDSMKTRKKYRDVADAAQAAFESAAYAAAAARAAVELSRSEPHNPDDHDSPSTGQDNENQAEEMKRKNAAELKRSMSTATSDSGEDIVMMTRVSSGETVPADPFEKELQFDESDIETEHEQNRIQSHSQIPSGFQTGLKLKSVIGLPVGHAAEGSGRQNARGLNIEKRPISMRTRQVRGY